MSTVDPIAGCADRWTNFERRLRAAAVFVPCGCLKCGYHGEVKQCARCQGVSYCGKDCQAADWQTHKAACNKEEADKLKLRVEQWKRTELGAGLHARQEEAWARAFPVD